VLCTICAKCRGVPSGVMRAADRGLPPGQLVPGCKISTAFMGRPPAAVSPRHQSTACREDNCQRLATSDTRFPGTSVSATIRALSSADLRRRRAGPVRIPTRRNPSLGSSLMSKIAIARSQLPQANQALPGPPLNKSGRRPLTLFQVVPCRFRYLCARQPNL
jgi:hypothetical protein